jgi:hypothetical protein
MQRPGGPPRHGLRAALLSVGLFAVYVSNGREIGSADTIPALLQPIAMLRGDGLTLDRFAPAFPELPYSFVRRRGLLLSRYPLGAPAIAVPFTAPQLALLDRARPGWETTPGGAFYWARHMGKISAAAITALAGAAIYWMLCALGLGAVALPATVIVALGSTLWSAASQSLWAHGPAVLSLATAVALLASQPLSRRRLLAAGGACALLVWCRPHVAFLAALIAAWTAWHQRRRSLWFFILPVALGAPLLAYNLFYFDSMLGGYADLSRMVGIGSHAVRGVWGENVAESALGTLLSPNRGLFVFSPWVPLSLALLPAFAPALRRCSLAATLLWGLPVFFAQLALQSTWWAGWSFGPRYWTDVMPLFAIVLAFALAWTRDHSPGLRAALLAAGVVAIAIQAIGAYYYPSSYNAAPVNIDLQHERLWSWRDGELARCLREGPRGWE